MVHWINYGTVLYMNIKKIPKVLFCQKKFFRKKLMLGIKYLHCIKTIVFLQGFSRESLQAVCLMH